MINLLIYIYIFIIGLFIGSFLNVLIYRIPNNLSILGRSFCPNCRNQIKWYHNIPILSYLFLKGRCKYCNNKISIIYPLIEFITGFIFLLLFMKYNLSLKFIYLSLLFIILLTITIIDLKYYIIPNSLNLSILILYFLFYFVYKLNILASSSFLLLPSTLTNIKQALISVFISTSIVLLIYFIGIFIFKKEIIGFGDIKFIFVISFHLEPKLLISFLYISVILASIYSLILYLLKNQKYIAFGPFLCIASFISILYDKEIINILNKVFFNF